MIFGNAAWGFRETPIEKQFEITKKMGINILEVGIANAPNDIPLDVSDEEIERVKSLSKKYDVKISCAATGNDFTNGTDDILKIKKVIDICKSLDIKYLRLFTGFTPLIDITEECFDTMIASLNEVCNYATEKDVIPVIETHGAVNVFEDGVEHIMSTSTDIDTLKKILSLLPDNVKICYDPSNLYAVGIEKPSEFYREFKGKVAYAHFKDFRILKSGHLKPSFCGDSNMDWHDILNAMKDFDGFALFEYENVEDIEIGLKKCFDYITKII